MSYYVFEWMDNFYKAPNVSAFVQRVLDRFNIYEHEDGDGTYSWVCHYKFHFCYDSILSMTVSADKDDGFTKEEAKDIFLAEIFKKMNVKCFKEI